MRPHVGFENVGWLYLVVYLKFPTISGCGCEPRRLNGMLTAMVRYDERWAICWVRVGVLASKLVAFRGMVGISALYCHINLDVSVRRLTRNFRIDSTKAPVSVLIVLLPYPDLAPNLWWHFLAFQIWLL